jgi:hypothetical protein
MQRPGAASTSRCGFVGPLHRMLFARATPAFTTLAINNVDPDASLASIIPDRAPTMKGRSSLPWFVLGAGALLMMVHSRTALIVGAFFFVNGLVAVVRGVLAAAPPGSFLGRKRDRVALGLGTTAVSLALAVVALVFIRAPGRLAGQARDNCKSDPEIGWVGDLRDSDRAQGVKLEDTVGQRVQVIEHNKPHVLVMGDSVIYGWGVKEEETAVARLGVQMPQYQVLNGAVSGYSIDQYYLLLKRDLPRVNPKYVVVSIYAGNDWEMTVHDNAFGKSKPYFVLNEGELVHTNPNLSPHNCVDVLARSMLFKYLWRWRDTAQAVTRFLCTTPELPPGEDERVIAALLSEIKHMVEVQYHAKLLYVLSPDRNDLDNQDWIQHHSRLNDFRRLLKAGNFDFLDFHDDLIATKEPSSVLYIDPAHYTPRGHQLLADAIFKRLH